MHADIIQENNLTHAK